MGPVLTQAWVQVLALLPGRGAQAGYAPSLSLYFNLLRSIRCELLDSQCCHRMRTFALKQPRLRFSEHQLSYVLSQFGLYPP